MPKLNTKTCPHCSAVCSINDQYCGKCGYSFNSAAANYPTAAPSLTPPALSPQPPRRRNRKFIKALTLALLPALILAVASIIGVYIGKQSPTPAPTPEPINLITDGGFDRAITYCTNQHTSEQWHVGITTWCTDDPSNIGIDKDNHGEGPTPATSARLVSNTIEGKDTHLFAPAVQVKYGKTYEISYYLHLIHIANGKVFTPYIDELGINGDDLKSGIYETGAQRSSPTEETIVIRYSPSSLKVTYTRFYFIVSGNSNTLAFVDNVIWKEINE